MTSAIIKSAPVLPASGETSGKKTGRKLVRAISAESIYRCMLLFLDHIFYRRVYFVREALAIITFLLCWVTKYMITENSKNYRNVVLLHKTKHGFVFLPISAAPSLEHRHTVTITMCVWGTDKMVKNRYKHSYTGQPSLEGLLGWR